MTTRRNTMIPGSIYLALGIGFFASIWFLFTNMITNFADQMEVPTGWANNLLTEQAIIAALMATGIVLFFWATDYWVTMQKRRRRR